MIYHIYIPAFLLAVFAPQLSFSQNVQGVLLSASDRRAVTAAIVVNKRTRQEVYTDMNGRFSIAAVGRDTLLFARKGYRLKTLTHYIYNPAAVDTFFMEAETHTLEEVEILSPMAKYRRDSAEARLIYRKSIGDAKKQVVISLSNGIVFHNLPSVLAATISGKRKRDKKFYRKLQSSENEKYADTRYNTAMVRTLTGMPEDSAGLFVNAYPVPHDYIRAATDLELGTWVRENYRKWRGNTQRK